MAALAFAMTSSAERGFDPEGSTGIVYPRRSSSLSFWYSVILDSRADAFLKYSLYSIRLSSLSVGGLGPDPDPDPDPDLRFRVRVRVRVRGKI